MKIHEIIVEASEEDQRLQDILSQEFDDEFGNPKLPEFFMLDKPSVVSLAVGYAKRPKYSTGKAIKSAVKQLYPEVKTKSSPDDKKKSQPAQRKRGAQVGNTNRLGTGKTKDVDVDTSKPSKSKTRVPRSLNPLSGLDTSSLGTTISTALQKAKGNMRNLDQFKIKR